MKSALLWMVFVCTATLSAGELYKQFQPGATSRRPEGIEWSTTYSYNAPDARNPRVLLIGDSICNGYQGNVRKKLAKKVNVSFWATSKCVTDKNYFRELEFILDGYRYDVISFNNGLHSLVTDKAEWENAFRQAVRFIRAKAPNARLFLTNSTPLRDPKRNETVKVINQITEKVAKEEKIPVLDLYSAMDKLDREKDWSDVFHFRPRAKEIQADEISNRVTDLLGITAEAGKVKQSATETGPDGRLK